MPTPEDKSVFGVGESPPRIQVVSTELVGGALTHGGRMNSPQAVARILFELIGRKDREHFVTLHLDARNRILSIEVVSVGSLVGSLVHPREVFKAAILQNAAAIICGHNHPSGDVSPSQEDWAIHKRLVEAGKLLGIEVLDFVIVADGDFVAFSYLSGAKEGCDHADETSVARSQAADASNE